MIASSPSRPVPIWRAHSPECCSARFVTSYQSVSKAPDGLPPAFHAPVILRRSTIICRTIRQFGHAIRLTSACRAPIGGMLGSACEASRKALSGFGKRLNGGLSPTGDRPFICPCPCKKTFALKVPLICFRAMTDLAKTKMRHMIRIFFLRKAARAHFGHRPGQARALGLTPDGLRRPGISKSFKWHVAGSFGRRRAINRFACPDLPATCEEAAPRSLLQRFNDELE